MNETPKLSVIVPVYNAEPYIEQCMDSLVNQTMFSDMEIIAVDDGSTDASGKILDMYAEFFPNITVVHQECISQANAVNRGWKMAKGEYIAECDADDFCSLRMYEWLYEAATDPRLNEHADVVRCGFFGVWDNGYTQPNYLRVPEEHWRVNPQEIDPKSYGLVFGQMVLLPAGIYRREFILQNELFWREGGQNYEDTAVTFKIRATAKDYRFVPKALYYYRRGNPNSGSATIKDEYAICEQYEEIERYCTEHDLPFMDYMDTRRYYDYLWSFMRTPDERRVDFLIKCMEDFQNHPAKKEYFNSEEDFRQYCIIKYGAWIELGVKE